MLIEMIQHMNNVVGKIPSVTIINRAKAIILNSVSFSSVLVMGGRIVCENFDRTTARCRKNRICHKNL